MGQTWVSNFFFLVLESHAWHRQGETLLHVASLRLSMCNAMVVIMSNQKETTDTQWVGTCMHWVPGDRELGFGSGEGSLKKKRLRKANYSIPDLGRYSDNNAVL